MDMTIDQQVALDEALVPHASRLRIGKSNFRLKSDITFKESTLQLELWATATVYHHSIRFKMDKKKCIVNLKYFREMLHICPRLPGKTFDELLFKEEILGFLRFLRHSGEIKKLIDILWGTYHKKNIDFSYLPWEDFIYQVEHKDAKKSNEMYYPRKGLCKKNQETVKIRQDRTPDLKDCSKAGSKDIFCKSQLNKVKKSKKYKFKDLFCLIFKVTFKGKIGNQKSNIYNFKPFKSLSEFIHEGQLHKSLEERPGVMLPIELTNEDIRNSEAYKEYYAIASGAAPPKTKASVRKTKSSSHTTITPPTATGTRLSTLEKGKQRAKSSKAKGLTVVSGVAMTEAEQMKLATKRSLQQTHIFQASGSAEAIQADCDVKVTNIILPGIPSEVYALVSTHKVAKEL
nr:hypothetical protein [Tanacetum cinerariifolium]